MEMKNKAMETAISRGGARFPIVGSENTEGWIPIDLSVHNPELDDRVIADRVSLEKYVFGKIEEAGAKGAFGGYGENRGIYRRSEVFRRGGERRSIHLGVDFWIGAGTEVRAFMRGVVHGFADNATPGDYGPTIILEHEQGGDTFYTLYGHLSRESLIGLEVGMRIADNQVISTLGEPHENLDWPPHLHFQIIKNIGEYRGDYPGVCLPSEAELYLDNCEDPMAYFG